MIYIYCGKNIYNICNIIYIPCIMYKLGKRNFDTGMQ